jgi:undecaprenyl diphosphate synthase
MKKSEELTACDDKEKKLDLVVAASYGGRWDIINAVNSLKDSNKENISEDDLTSLLSTAKFNDPDLCIRTGKEQRISNFLLWQLAYTELYFPDLLWPDFNDDEFEKALLEYSTRTRRFGDRSNFSL